jgi:hypothetical protein
VCTSKHPDRRPGVLWVPRVRHDLTPSQGRVSSALSLRLPAALNTLQETLLHLHLAYSVYSQTGHSKGLSSEEDSYFKVSFLALVCPTTASLMKSDLHRVCLPRLCYVFRLSQSLDVLIPFTTLLFCFTQQPFVALTYRVFPSPITHFALRQSVPAMSFLQPC